MKTKQEILKMNREDVLDYKWSEDLDRKGETYHYSNCFCCSDCSRCSNCSYCSRCSDCSRCSNCSYCSRCSNCSYCSHCSDCSDCFGCRNAKGLKYAICNVEVGKEAYEKWMKENQPN